MRRVSWLALLRQPQHPRLAMLAWGIGIGLLGAFVLWGVSPASWPIVPSRAVDLHASMAVLKQGGPLLLGRHGLAGSFYPIGSDEEGIYVYLPLLSRLLGVAEPLSIVRYCYVGLYGLTIAIYPLVFYKLTGSLLAGFAAPLMLLVCVISMGFEDTYWVLAWGALTLLPLVYLLSSNWPRFGWVALVSLAFVAGWLSSMRANSGIPIVIAVAIVLLITRSSTRRTLAVLALLVVAYISITAFVFTAIRAHSDHRLSPVAKRDQPAPHAWHSLYIGLGYLPNSYGIHYNDNIAVARVQHDAPGTPYLSSHYVAVIRKAYFEVVGEHPLEVLWQYTAKAVVIAADAFPYLLPALLTLPAMLLLGFDLRRRRRWLLLTAPVVILSATPAIAAIPNQSYEQGLYGALGVVGILGLCWGLAQLETAIVERRGLRPALVSLWAALLTPRPGQAPLRRCAQISVVGLMVSLVLVIAGHFIRTSADRWSNTDSGVLIEHAWL